MAKVGAQRAAELTGKSKSTIQRAMKNGKVSYETDHNGRRVIDVAELERAFGLVSQNVQQSAGQAVEAELEKATNMLETERLKMRIKLLEEQFDVAKEQIEDLKEQRDQWQKQAQQVLITSQYSQKQAEDLKEELKERERRARLRRQQEMERRVKASPSMHVPMRGENENRPVVLTDLKAFDIQSLWGKIKGQHDQKKRARA